MITYATEKLYKGSRLNLEKALVEPSPFLRLAKLRLLRFIRKNVFGSQKTPEMSKTKHREAIIIVVLVGQMKLCIYILKEGCSDTYIQ